MALTKVKSGVITDGTITKAGSFYSYGDLRLGQGRESAKEYLSQHPELSAEVEGRIRASSANLVPVVVEVEAEDEEKA